MERISNHFALLVFLSVAIGTGTNGCKTNISPSPDVEHATLVTFSQLKEATQEEAFFDWVGCDRKFHYFKTQNGYYRLSTSFDIPSLHGSSSVTIEGFIENEFKPGSRGRSVCIDGESIRTKGHLDPR